MPVLPGKNGDWKQHPLIKTIFADCELESASCDGGTRRLEDWVGKGSGVISRGGRPAKASEPADGGWGAAAEDSAAARTRGRPRGPAPVSEDSDEKADVRAMRAMLIKTGASCLRKMCRTIGHGLVNQSSRWWKC